MRNKIPRVQESWREYKKLSENEQSKIGFYERVIAAIEILMYLAPHIIAIHWYSSFSVPNKHMGHRRNRNI